MNRTAFLCIALLGMMAVGTTASFDGLNMMDLFKAWKHQHQKQYESAEELLKRFEIFAQNMVKIMEHNRSGKSWTMGMNEFGDLTWEEFKATKLNAVPMRKTINSNIKRPALGRLMDLPDTVDWVKEGVVNSVQNQGQCGSCWAFSAVAATESAIALKTGKLIKLSEQELVDCSGSYGNMGCNGGLMDRAFEFVKDQGLCKESDYSYSAHKSWSCRANKGFFSNGCTAAGYISGFVDVQSNDEMELKAAVAQQPVSVAIEADQKGFQFYSGGVFDGECGDRLDHGVVVVGYGTDADSGKMYWTIRNSWGASWGEEGYIRVIRKDSTGEEGQCGIAMMASYPASCSVAATKCA